MKALHWTLKSLAALSIVAAVRKFRQNLAPAPTVPAVASLPADAPTSVTHRAAVAEIAAIDISTDEQGRPLSLLQRFYLKTKTLLTVTFREWSQDNILRLSSSLSYYTIFALSPLLVLVLVTCGALFGDEAVRGQLDNQLQSFMGPKAALAVQDMVKGAMNPSGSVLATILGVLSLIFGATGFFGEVKAALNTIWGAEEVRERTAVSAWMRTRMASFGMIIVIMTMLMISLVFSTAVAFASKYLAGRFAIDPAIWGGLGFIVGVGIETVLFALLFRVLPDVRFPWRDVWWGAAVTAFLFEIGKWVLSWYLGQESTSSGYGAAGSLMIVLMWIYYSSIIVLTGAEFTQVHSRLRGKGASV